MPSADGKKWIVFNGEIYNYRELRQEISDYPYRSQTDTEVILAAYERWGEACVEHFNGMFAFAIWDAYNKKLFLARDRLGIKPLFYAKHDGAFYFASEVQALLAAGVPAKPNYDMWADYLVEGYYDHTYGTLFDSIYSLQPGHTITADTSGEVIDCQYWLLPDQIIGKSHIGFESAVSDYAELLEDSVRLRLRADVPVGLNLSGGLDSATLMAVMDQVGDSGYAAFTASCDDNRYDEYGFALTTPTLQDWRRSGSFLYHGDVPALAQMVMASQAAPFGGIATLSYHDLHNHIAETSAKVVLEGQGADETLGGYAYYQTAQEERIYQDGSKGLIPETISPDIVPGWRTDFPSPFEVSATNMMYRDLRYTKLPRVLRMNDHLSMAHGIELREPYLDHRLVEFAFSLPLEFKIHNFQNKRILRSAMKGRLPDRIRLAPKRAVVTPQREWMRGPLKPWVDEIIHSPSFAQRGLFNVPEVHKAWERYCNEGGDNSFFVWQWICTELWFRTFQDARAVDIQKTGMLVS